jgi:hypothetical protein
MHSDSVGVSLSDRFGPLAEPPLQEFQRTERSLAFEAAWREARGSKLVPDRKEMSLRPFKTMMADIMLTEVIPGPPFRTCFKVVGEHIRARVQQNFVGRSYFEFLPRERHGLYESRFHSIVTKPCGLWQVAGVYYQRGYSQLYEMTIFPVFHEGHPPQMISCTTPLGGKLPYLESDISILSLSGEQASVFLDIGAGLPSGGPVTGPSSGLTP